MRGGCEPRTPAAEQNEQVATLTTAAELDRLIAGGTPHHILDVRYRLDQPDGLDDYREGHIPGAVYVDLDAELARHGTPSEGRHPLPSLSTLQSAAQRWGLRQGRPVIIYDDYRSLSAARAWWLLTRSGIEDVRILDGGVTGWLAAGFSLEAGEVTPAQGDIELHDIVDDVLTVTTVGDFAETGVLLDVRAANRFRGEVEPFDPIAGHIPGAVNLPSDDYMDGAYFRRADQLRSLFEAAGVRDGVAAAAYCGSGITAAQALFAAELAGFHLRIYPGSWSEWSNTPGAAIATGPS